MKLRFLLIAMCFLATIGKAQTKWSDQYSAINRGDLNNYNIAALSPSNEVIIVGVLGQELSFGNFTLKPVEQSSYLLKYDSDGNKQWAVAIAGSTTTTAMTLDDEGNIYVAGIFSGKVTLNSTDTKTQTIEAVTTIQNDKKQRASFIAKYSAAGVLQKVQKYQPKPFEAAVLEGFSYYQNISIKVTDMIFSEGKLLTSVLYDGIVESNGQTIKASYIDSGSSFKDVTAGAILEINKDELTINNVYATLQPENNIKLASIAGVQIASSEGQLFGVFYAKGDKHNLTIKGETQSIDFAQGNSNSSGHVFVHLDQATGDKKSVTTNFTQKKADYYYSLSSLDYANGKLFLAGIFRDALVFKPELVARGTMDVFAVVLDANNMSKVNFVANTSEYEAKFTSSTLSDDQFLVSCNEAYNSGILAINQTGVSTMKYTSTDDDIYTNAIVFKDGATLKVEMLSRVGPLFYITKVTLEKQNTAINDPGSATDAEISFVATESRLSFAEIADAMIYNSTGVLVRTVNKSQSVNLSDLPKGIYVVSAQTANGTSRLKFVKN